MHNIDITYGSEIPSDSLNRRRCLVVKLRSAFLLVIAVIAVAGAAVADVVVMRDGRELEGRIIRETDESLTLQLTYG